MKILPVAPHWIIIFSMAFTSAAFITIELIDIFYAKGLTVQQQIELDRELRQLDRDLREDMKGEAAFIKELENEERRKDMSKGMEIF